MPESLSCFRWLFKTRWSEAASGWHYTRGENKTGKILYPNRWLNQNPKRQSSARAAKQDSLSCRCRLQGISKRERKGGGGQGQQRTGGLFHNLTSHRCSESAPPLPVCERRVWKFTVRNRWRRSGPEGGGLGKGMRQGWRREERRNDLGAGISVKSLQD